MPTGAFLTEFRSPIKVSGELQLVQGMVFCGNSVMCVRELTERFDSETSHLAGREDDLQKVLSFLE
jgi:hypothetical protein